MKKLENYIIQHAPNRIIKLLRVTKYNLNSSYGYTFGRLRLSKKSHIIALQRGYSKSPSKLNVDHTTKKWIEAYDEYREGLPLVWADTPCPGNDGDWLAPYILKSLSGENIKFVSQSSRRNTRHYLGLGSIAGSANRHSQIIGSGIAKIDTTINKNCDILSVRGPYTKDLADKGRTDKVQILGDPAFLLPRIYTPRKYIENNSVILVRHINHRHISVDPQSKILEVPIYAATPTDIENFIDQITNADLVVTSAMHCFLTCVAYGQKAILFKPEVDDKPVPGDGIKYRDSLAGVNLPEINPVSINLGKALDDQLKDLEPFTEKFDPTSVDDLCNLYKGILNV